jgi:hypothetical protein
MPVFSEREMAHFDEQGYVILHDAVPAENLQAVIDAIAWWVGGPEKQRWYKPPYQPGGIMQFFHHQALWDNRQHPRVYEAFKQVHGREDLWVSHDRVSMKLPRHPEHPEYDNAGFAHWDADLSKLPLKFGVQGVLALTDTTPDMGGFRCRPGIHKELAAWVAAQPPGANLKYPHYQGDDMQAIPMRAGDLLIWQQGLAHGPGANLTDRPRLAQYIAMNPQTFDDEQRRLQRIKWLEGRAETGLGIDERRWEEKFGQPVKLTPLGRKLVGYDRW